MLGDLEIDTFTIPHDAVDPIGCCLRWQGVKVGVATDLGYLPDSVKYHIRGCDLLMLESNYDTEMLRVSPYPFFVRQRVGSRNGHLSNHAVAGFLSAEFDRKARTLVLAHLSEHNNHPEVARLFAQSRRSTRPAPATPACISPASTKPPRFLSFDSALYAS